jgi:hypothetical protein
VHSRRVGSGTEVGLVSAPTKVRRRTFSAARPRARPAGGGYRHGFFQSSSVSRFTAGAAGFFIEPLRERRLQNVRAPVTCVLGCSLCEPPNTRTVAHVECARSTPPAIEPHPSRTIPASLFASAAQWAPLLRSRITRSMPFTTRATFSVSILSGMSLGR